jgi:hypothetical protein
MAIYATLHNSGGEIGRERVWVNDPDSAELSAAIHDAIADWTLAVDDVIKIVEEKS